MKVQLQIGDFKYAGWENISISKSMESIADTFQMEIFKGDEVVIEDDTAVKVLVDDEVFLTGYVDDTTIEISDTARPLKITGRSKPCDLVDCNISENKQYNKQNAKQIIKDLAFSFGIDVSSDFGFELLDIYSTKVGETYFNTINRLCKQTNMMPISDKLGNIKLIKNDNKTISRAIKDKDLKSIRYFQARKNRFNSYTYKKEGIVTDITDGTQKDDSVKRFRPFVAINTEEKTNVDLAKWKKNSNAVKSVLLEVVIYGWDIEINTIVKIESSVVNNSFLVKSVVYKKSGSGTVASATLVSKDLYNV